MKAKNIFFFFLICLLISTNIGKAQWVQTNGPYGGHIESFAVVGTNLFTGTWHGGVFISTDNGTSWVNTGLTNTSVISLAVSGTNLFAGTWDGVFLSTNSGASWTSVNTGLTNTFIQALAISGTNLFAGTNTGVFRSTNNGINWNAVNNGLTDLDIECFLFSGTNIFVGTNGGGIFISTNNGTSWTAVNTGLTNLEIECFLASGTNIFVGTSGGGVFISTDNGSSWVNAGLSTRFVHALAISGTNLFAGTSISGVYRSTNNGTSWTQVNTGLTTRYVYALAVSGMNIFAGTLFGGVFLSTNNGASWIAINNGVTTSVQSVALTGTNLFAGTYGGGVFNSTNIGASWTPTNTGLPIDISVYAFVSSGTNLFAGTSSRVFRSTNNGTSWTAVSSGMPNTVVLALAVSGTNLFAGTVSGVFISTNNGASWTMVNNGLTNTYVRSLAVSGTNLFAGTTNGVFLSANNGTSWTEVNNGLTDTYVFSLAVSGTNLFAGTYGGVFISTNNGASWTVVNNGLTNTYVWSLAVSGTNLFAGINGGGVFLSTNNGTSWMEVNNGLSNSIVQALAVSNTNLFAGTYGGGVWRRPLSEMIANLITLISPGDSYSPGYTIATLNPLFFWNEVTSASSYGLQLYKEINNIYELIYNSDNITATSIVLPAGTISDNSQYYWQVRGRVDNNWTSYSTPYYFNVNVASLTPTIFLSSSVIQAGEEITFSGINFSINNQAKAIITSNNGYNTTITVNTNNIGYLIHSLILTAPGNYTIYCKDINTGYLSNQKSFEVQNTANSNLIIILPYPGYQANINEPVLVEWRDKLETGAAYPVVGSQRGYNYLIEKSSNNGNSWDVITTISGFDDIDKIKTFDVDVTIAEPSNYLIRVKDGYVTNRITANVPIQILSTTTSDLIADFIWDYSYPTNVGQPIGVAADGTGRFYIKVSDPGNTISQVTFTLFDVDNNNETRTLGKLKEAINITTYDEEANNANQLSITIGQPQVNNEFWCWYVAPDDFIGLNTSISDLPSREVKVRIKTEYLSGPDIEIIKKITIKRLPVVLVHGFNSSVTMWNEFAQNSAFSKFRRYRLKIGPQESYAYNASRILIPMFPHYDDPTYSIPAIINDFRKSKIACNQVFYVGHSMGGIVLRYAETYKPESFRNQKNYNKGYINKFITLDTPHKGTPFANFLESSLPIVYVIDYLLYGISAFDNYYTRDLFGHIDDIHPAIRDLKMNSFDINATLYKSHVFVGDMIEGQEDLTNISENIVESLNINPGFRELAGYLLYYLPAGGGLKGLLTVFDIDYYNLSGSSISNSDLIVPLSSQLSDLQLNDSKKTYTVNFHSEATGTPSIEMNSASQVASLLDQKMSSPLWGTLPALQQSSSNLHPKEVVQNFLMDSTFINILAPGDFDSLFIDSVFNLTFSLSDTTNLKKISVFYQDKFIEDTIVQTNYNYSLSVSNNYLDTQTVAVLALYSLNDSIVVSNKTVSVIIKSNDNPITIKSKENFIYLLKNEDYYPEVDIYFDTFIGKIGRAGTALNLTIANPDILSLDYYTKKIKAIDNGETFAVIDYRGLKDTVYFKINGDITTGVEEDHNSANLVLPDKFELFQNYPNPFNPTTTIKYSVPQISFVKIQIYDILGREVKKLVNEEKSPGNYEIKFNANQFASGVYFYRMQTDNFVETKKLILMK